MANVVFEKIERQMRYIVLPLFRRYSTKNWVYDAYLVVHYNWMAFKEKP